MKRKQLWNELAESLQEANEQLESSSDSLRKLVECLRAFFERLHEKAQQIEDAAQRTEARLRASRERTARPRALYQSSSIPSAAAATDPIADSTGGFNADSLKIAAKCDPSKLN